MGRMVKLLVSAIQDDDGSISEIINDSPEAGHGWEVQRVSGDLRERIATATMQTLLAGFENSDALPSAYASAAVELADALLAALDAPR